MGNRIETIWKIALTAVVVSGMLLIGACGGSKEKKIEVAAGEYYSEAELERLSAGMKNRYCNDLGSLRESAQQELEAKTRELEETNEKIKTVGAKRAELDRERVRLEVDIRALKEQITAVDALPDSVRIRVGESLETIAALPDVYNDSTKWWKLLEANEQILLDPFYCLSDTVIYIPRNWPAN